MKKESDIDRRRRAGQAGAKKPAPGKKNTDIKAAPGENKRRSNRNVSAPIATSIKLGRSLRTGGAYIVKASRSAYKGFNAFTQSGGAPQEKRRRERASTPFTRNITYIIFLLSIFLIMSVALMLLNNSSVVVEKITLSVVGLDKNLEGYTILHLSDLHGRSFGTKQASLLRTINSLSYNLVVMTGDMVGRSGDPQPLYDLLDGMTANRDVLFISGDSDPDPLRDAPRDITGTLEEMVLEDWVMGAEARGATFLSETMPVAVGSTNIWFSPASQLSVNIPTTLELFKTQVEQETEGTIFGLEADHDQLPFTDYRYRQLVKLDEVVHQMQPTDLHIALTHYPPDSEYIQVTQQLGDEAEYTFLPPVDLVLAGHYCGGGWKLPFLGALFVPNTRLDRHGWFPAQEDVQGMKQLGTAQLYTSPGLSVTDRIYLPNFRLFNSPTVTVITLTSAITADLLANE